MPYTRAQKQTEIARELAMRRRVYPHLIGRGTLSKEDADRQIKIMEAIWDDYAEEDDARQKNFLRMLSGN